MIVKLLLPLFLSFHITNFLTPILHHFSPHEMIECAAMKRISTKKKNPKFRWKKIFRPIRIFKNKIKFWLLAFGGIVSLLGLSFYVFDKSNIEIHGDFLEGVIWIFLAIFALSVLAIVLLLVAIPIVIVIRVIREMKWRKRFKGRYRKCYKF